MTSPCASPPDTTAAVPSTPAAVAGPVLPRASRLLLAVLLAAAALVHLALAPEHYAEQPVFGAFFAVAGVGQLVLAAQLARPAGLSWRLLGLVRTTSLSLVAVFIATRLVTPPLALVLTEHLALSAPVMTVLALALAATFLGANTAIARTAARAGTHEGRPALAAAPAFLAAPACCGAPLLAFLGTGAVAALSYYTPVLLFAVAMSLSLHGSVMLRGLRLARARRPAPLVPDIA